MKAILIVRVRTEEQREAGNSLPTQIAQLEKYCQILYYVTHGILKMGRSSKSPALCQTFL
jgi:hypothetical protein